VAQWAAFVGLTGFVCIVFLGLAWLSQSAVDATPSRTRRLDRTDPGTTVGTSSRVRVRATTRPLSPGLVLLNVALTQGVLGALVLGGAFYFQIPWRVLGVTAVAPWQVATGAALGAGLWLANEAATTGAGALGIEYDESVRELLTPRSRGGWTVLLGIVLPVIAVVEELVFRAALIGAVGAGFETPAWALVAVSTVAFAAGHGAQGRVGIAVTGVLGLGLAVAFVTTGSLLAVVLAHYVVNAAELLVHEGLGIDRPAVAP
jgi:membrane protease YdiL (CAAX protease family)